MRGKDLFKAIITTSFVLLLTYLFYGIFFGSVSTLMLSTVFQPTALHAEMPHYHLYMYFVSDIIYYLNTTIPEIHWFETVLYLLLIICTTIMFKYYFNYVYSVNTYSIVFIFILYVLFWMENLIFLEITRIAFVLCFTGLLSITLELNNERLNKKRCLSFILFYILFLIGYLIRFEVGIIALSLVILVFFFKNLVTYKYSGKNMLIAFLPILAIILIFYPKNELFFDRKIDDVSLNKIHSYYINVLDVGYYNSNNNLNNEDKIKIEAMQREFMADKKNIMNIKFLKRVTTANFFSINKLLLLNNYSSKFSYLYSLLKTKYKIQTFFFVVITLIYSIFLLLGIEMKLFLYTLLFNLTFWLTVLFITLTFKMEERALFPLLQFLAFANIFLVKDSRLLSENINAKFNKYISIVLLLITFVYVYNIHKQKINAKEQIDSVTEVWEEIRNKFDNKTLIFDLRSLEDLIYRKPFNLPNFLHPVKRSNPIIAYDSHLLLFLSDNYRKKMINFSGSTSMKEFYRTAYKKRNNIIHIYKNQRLKFFIKYLKNIHNIRLEFTPKKGKALENKFDNMKYYRLTEFENLNT